MILIYNFSQIVERIWRKKLYNCVSISGHATLPKGQTAVFGFISVDEIIIVNLFVFVMSLSSGLGQVNREDGVATKVCCTEPATARSVLVWNWFSAHGEKKDFGSEKNSASVVCSSWIDTAESLKGTTRQAVANQAGRR